MTITHLLLVLLFVTISSALQIEGDRVKLVLSSSARVEPYRQTQLTVDLISCGEFAATNLKTTWTFPQARIDLGESEFATSLSSSLQHEFRGTGRRVIFVEACINFDPNATNVWCHGGHIIKESFDVIVQYVRREIRDLPQAEWDLFVDAYHIMKKTPQDLLFQQYGPNCYGYDYITAYHLKAAQNVTCDQAHYWESFFANHRMFGLMIERSVQAIYPQLSIPYWDQAYDAEHYEDPLNQSPIWGDDFFGGNGDPSDWFVVKNGRFAGDGQEWPMAKSADWIDPTSPFRGSPFGFLRAPWNSNPKPILTRYNGDFLGFHDPRGHVVFSDRQFMENCVQSPNFEAFTQCMDSPFMTAHPWVHMFVGGATNPVSGDVTQIYDSPPQQFGLALARNVFASWISGVGVSVCPSKCSPDLINTDVTTLLESCRCVCTTEPLAPPQEGLMNALAEIFGLPVPAIVDGSDPRNMCSLGGVLGDMFDTSTSPNDPFFHIFHADMDRWFVNWQLNHIELGPYGLHPEQGFCPGHGLHDMLMGASGPPAFEVGLGTEKHSLTIAQLYERTLQPEFGHTQIASYRYEAYSAWGNSVENTAELPTDDFCNASSLLSYFSPYTFFFIVFSWIFFY